MVGILTVSDLAKLHQGQISNIPNAKQEINGKTMQIKLESLTMLKTVLEEETGSKKKKKPLNSVLATTW